MADTQFCHARFETAEGVRVDPFDSVVIQFERLHSQIAEGSRSDLKGRFNLIRTRNVTVQRQ